jgi:membrane-associated phospholipid phosphatase
VLSSAGNTFAELASQPVGSGGRMGFVLHISPAEFTMPRHRVLLSLTMNSGTGGLMLMRPQGRAFARMMMQRRFGTNDLMVASVGPGTFDLMRMGPQGTSSAGSGTLQVALVGDVTGQFQVNRQDIEMIRARLGQRPGMPGYLASADPDGDGLINHHDLMLALMNLGASTRIRPLTATLQLDPASNPDGNGIVVEPTFTVEGQTEPGATVTLVPQIPGIPTQTTTANLQGQYSFTLTTGVGQIPLQVNISDAFGQTATASLTVNRGDVIIAWNQTALEAIRADMSNVGLASRNLAMVQAAVYDAVNNIDHIGSVYHVAVAAPAGASAQAAASAAAYQVLLSLYPTEKPLLDATLGETLATIPDGPSKTEGISEGLAVANGILAWRQNDGSNVDVPYVPGNQPGQWRPTPPDYSPAWGPDWGQVTPFAITNPTAYLPPPPPALTSPAYAAAVNQVESLGAKDSTTRTPDQTQIALFWAYDLPGMGPPPVHFNQVIQEIALQQHNTFDQNARLFGLANVAMADAGIVAWDTKYTYNMWRPITAIQLANTDGNPATVADPTWQPLGSPGEGRVPNYTPPFPSYVSGHATFGGALFTVLADFYGTDTMNFTLTSDELPGVTRSYTSFSQAALENAMSRVYLGVHYLFDSTNGINVGDAIGNTVYNTIMTPGS